MAFCGSVPVGDTVSTRDGRVQGKLGSSARVFRGVPYGAPPVGDKRWAPPEPVSPWNATIKAFDDPVACVQRCVLPEVTCPDPTRIGENCLFMNIFTPLDISEPLPVLFFIHGGNFKQGFVGGLMFDAQKLVKEQNIILVFVQYRLGALGFLVHDTIQGNFGLQDQRLGLQWVSNNIAAFGGDPSKITIGGQSAGAQSSAMHMLDPSMKTLFRGAILESIPWGITLRNAKDAGKLGADFADKLNCSDTVCLQKASLEDILNAQVALETQVTDPHLFEIFEPWAPSVGTTSTTVTRQPVEYFLGGKATDKPYMMGTLSQECVVFIYEAWGKPLSKLYTETLIAAIFKLSAPKILKEYQFPSVPDLRPNISVMATDYVFECSGRAVAAAGTSSNAPVFLYQFDKVVAGKDGQCGKAVWGTNYSACWDKVCHGAELPLVFSTAGEICPSGLSEAETRITHEMNTAWGNFVHNLDPNKGSPSTLEWPAYTKAVDQIMRFSDDSGGVVGLRKEKCDFWDNLGYVF